MIQCTPEKDPGVIMTVNGPILPDKMGTSLIHEHILVDFSGATEINNQKWEHKEVMQISTPHIKTAQRSGVETLIECTPAYLGRDVILLKKISDSSGMHIITNTGYYGARENKFLPSHGFTETAEMLAQRWISEWENGIDGTEVKPGFIKIGVDNGPLSEVHKKLISAAGKTHLKTGLTIASHSGPSTPAFEQLEILEKEGVAPEAFIWVHAQAEKDLDNHIKAAEKGAWVSLDGVNEGNINEYVKMIRNMKDHRLLNKLLISHDAGWYTPGEENGGDYRGYTAIFEKLVPALRAEDFSEKDIDQLLVKNPANAFIVRVRSID